MGTAIIMYTLAIEQSQASYVSILTMLTPIVMILVSRHYYKETVTHRKLAGITLAMIGALIVVVAPLLLGGYGGELFYPLATVLALAQTLFFAIGFISMRKANEAGVPVLTSVGLTAPIGLVLVLPLFFTFGDTARMPLNIEFVAATVYSAIGLAVIIRAVTIAAYERIGIVSVAALTYVENLVAIVLPLLLIGEILSIEMVVGAGLILCGVYLIESHRSRHVRHHVLHRHH